MSLDKEKLPKLLKRKHIINDIGFSDSLYYRLIRTKKLPTVKVGKRTYIDRDKLSDLIEKGLINTYEEGVK